MMKKLLKSQRGMTLIEIMVVLVLIAGIGSIAAVAVKDRQVKGQINITKASITALSNALDQYRLDNYRYPTTDQGLKALVEKPSSGKVPKNYPSNGYLSKKKLPTDAWDEDFRYESDGRSFTIKSNGPDLEEGTEDDISSDDIE
jgi:general secretion pathway protein G